VRAIEDLSPEMLGSVLLLDGDRRMHGCGTGPADSLQGLPRAPAIRPAGTAAARGQMVVVTDIALDPLWRDYRDLALGHGLRACWSVPIKDSGGAVLGTFGAYYREPRAPGPQELRLLETASRLASISLALANRLATVPSGHPNWLATSLRLRPHDLLRRHRRSLRLSINQRYAQWLGSPREALVGRHIRDVVDQETYRLIEPQARHVLAGHEARYERRQRSHDGRQQDFEVQYVPDFGADGAVVGYFVMLTDVTERKRDEQMLYFLANHDQLTSLPNRNLFAEHLTMAIAQAARAGEKVAALFIDLDRFKNVNDTLGHQIGDALLQQVPPFCGCCARRRGGAAERREYTVMVRPVRPAGSRRAKLLSVLSSPFEVDGHELFVTGGIGISFPDDSPDAAALLKNADIAYRSKVRAEHLPVLLQRNHRGYLRAPDAGDHLRRALEREEFVLHFQPIIDLRGDRVTGIEALIRWGTGPRHGLGTA
jgi:diguanylate cyclase (GGDEF)-like protein/PAS domain S-box-containing protein